MSPSVRAERRRRWREAARLAASRLAKTGGARFGRVTSGVLLLVFAGAALAGRAGDATPTAILGFAPAAARTAAWLAAGPIALAAANGRSAADRTEGIDALAATFGVGRRPMELGRAVAVMAACAVAMAVPSLATAAVATALQPTPADAWVAAGLLPAMAAFALVAGVSVGGAATLAERLSPERGRSALLALVVLPWLLTDAAGWHGASLPGALEAFLRSALALMGLGYLT